MGSSFLIVVGLLMANGLFAGAESRSERPQYPPREFIRRRDRRALAVGAAHTPERFRRPSIAMTTIGTTAAAFGARSSSRLDRFQRSGWAGCIAHSGDRDRDHPRAGDRRAGAVARAALLDATRSWSRGRWSRSRS
jgi:hypothetical protein